MSNEENDVDAAKVRNVFDDLADVVSAVEGVHVLEIKLDPEILSAIVAEAEEQKPAWLMQLATNDGVPVLFSSIFGEKPPFWDGIVSGEPTELGLDMDTEQLIAAEKGEGDYPMPMMWAWEPTAPAQTIVDPWHNFALSHGSLVERPGTDADTEYPRLMANREEAIARRAERARQKSKPPPFLTNFNNARLN